MNKSERDLERLESLLQRDSYASLSEEEQQFVLTVLPTEEEYERIRQMTVKLRQGLTVGTNLVPKPSIQTTVRHRLASTKAASPVKLGNFRRMLVYRIPTYQVAAAIGLWVGWIWFTNSRNGFQTESSQPVALATVRVDTVYQPTRPDTVFIEKRVPVLKPHNQPAEQTPSDPSLSFIPTIDDQMPADSLEWLLEAKGTTMREDSTLSDLLVTDF
jgi:hypothetical protein